MSVKLCDVVDMDKLAQHVNNRRVSVQHHPTLPLSIYNYTHLAKNDGNHWGDGTIDWCRGLIVDRDSNIVARPFKKFHNINTPSIPETFEAALPKTPPTILEKLDGSLGIYYQYDGHWGIATRGSFTSPQATWATEWMTRCARQGRINPLFPNWLTPLFEIIYNENRIVLKYPFEELILLGIVDNEDGWEFAYNSVRDIAYRKGFNVVKQYAQKSLADCLAENEKGREGYVLTYGNGDHNPPLKIKVKFADYVRLHKVVTGLNPRGVWELLSSGADLAPLQSPDLPDHFKTWLLQWRSKLVNEFDVLYAEATLAYINRPIYYGTDKRQYRAACAAHFKQFPKVQPLCFAMLDGRDVTPLIWKMIEPRGDDKSFRTEGE